MQMSIMQTVCCAERTEMDSRLDSSDARLILTLRMNISGYGACRTQVLTLTR